MDKVHQDKQLELQEKMEEVKQLQREKTELERAKHTEIVKLRLEVFICYTHSYKPHTPQGALQWAYIHVSVIQYDAKMLKMQKQHQQLKAQANHTSSANSDIFRKVPSGLSSL